MVKKLMVLLILIIFFIYGCDQIVREKTVSEESKKYCEQDSDCVWAFSLNSCCSCPKIYNKEFVDSNNEFVMYEIGKDYSSLITVDCSGIVCGPCAPMSDLECTNNKCKRKI